MWLSTFEISAARRSFAPSQKSRRHSRSFVWTEALSDMIFVAAQKLFIIVCTQPKARNVFVIESDRIFVLTDQSDDLLSLLVNSTRSSFYRKSRYEPRTSYHGLFSHCPEVPKWTLSLSRNLTIKDSRKSTKKVVAYLTTADEISFKLRSFHNILSIHRLQ